MERIGEESHVPAVQSHFNRIIKNAHLQQEETLTESFVGDWGLRNSPD